MDREELEKLEGQWNDVLSKDGLSTRLYKKQVRESRKTAQGPRKARQREVLFRDEHAGKAMLGSRRRQIEDPSCRPETELEALIQTPPFEDPIESKEESYGRYLQLMDRIAAVVGDELADILVRHHVSRETVQSLADEYGIGKSTLVARLAEARSRLAEELQGWE